MTTAAFPEGVTHKARYGPRLKATADQVKGHGMLSYVGAAELFDDLFGIPLSAGTLVDIELEVGERLEEVN